MIAIDRLPEPLRSALDQRHLGKLDGLRAVAALLVVYYHFGLPVPAGFGVLAFFVLSGFLITWLLLLEEDRCGTVSLRNFYVRRSLRIFPAFYCYWFLTTGALLAVGGHILWGQAMSSFFYVANYYQGLNGYPSSGYSHTWSLGIEEQFYLLWPVAFLALQRRHQWRLAAATGVVVAVWTLRLFAELVGNVPEEYIYTAFEMRIDHILIGCILALILHDGLGARVWRPLVTHRAFLLLPIGVLLASLCLDRIGGGTRYRNLVGFIVDPIAIALLIPLLLAAGNHPSVRWLDSRLARYLGGISYSIYLYQQMVIGPTRHLLNRFGVSEVVTAVVVPLAVIAAAGMSYRLVESPFLRMKERLAAASNGRNA